MCASVRLNHRCCYIFMYCALNQILERVLCVNAHAFFIYSCVWMCACRGGGDDTMQLNLMELNCLLEDWQIKQYIQRTSWPDMKLDFKNFFSFVPLKGEKASWRREGASYHESSQLTATLRKIFQMFADVGIFWAVFYVVKGRACAVECCKNSALPSSGKAKSHEARELSDC